MISAQGIDKVAVIGTTSWGTTLSVLLAADGSSPCCLWSWTEEEAAQLRREGENGRRQPGLTLPAVAYGDP